LTEAKKHIKSIEIPVINFITILLIESIQKNKNTPNQKKECYKTFAQKQRPYIIHKVLKIGFAEKKELLE
jgi:hypothetical protein